MDGFFITLKGCAILEDGNPQTIVRRLWFDYDAFTCKDRIVAQGCFRRVVLSAVRNRKSVLRQYFFCDNLVFHDERADITVLCRHIAFLHIFAVVFVSQRNELIIPVEHVDLQTLLDGIEQQNLRGEFHVLKASQGIRPFPGSLFVFLSQRCSPNRFVLCRVHGYDHLSSYCLFRIMECFNFSFDDCAYLLFSADRFQHLQHPFEEGNPFRLECGWLQRILQCCRIVHFFPDFHLFFAGIFLDPQ